MLKISFFTSNSLLYNIIRLLHIMIGIYLLDFIIMSGIYLLDAIVISEIPIEGIISKYEILYLLK